MCYQARIPGREIIDMKKFASISLFLAITFVLSTGSGTRKVVDDGIVVEDVTLISPERQSPVPHVSVVIRNGNIPQIPPPLVAAPHPTRLTRPNPFLIPRPTAPH